MKESKLTAVMSFVHVTVVLSLLTFGTIFFSLGVLTLPATYPNSTAYSRFHHRQGDDLQALFGVRKSYETVRRLP